MFERNGHVAGSIVHWKVTKEPVALPTHKPAPAGPATKKAAAAKKTAAKKVEPAPKAEPKAAETEKEPTPAKVGPDED